MKTITIKERPDLKTSEILAMCKAKFPVWSFYDDARLDNDFPAPKEATERAFLASQEPDSATLGLSVREAEAKGHTEGITIRERMLLELAYFAETGQHMDVEGVTLCSGSRLSGGGVVGAYWYGGEFGVSWSGLDYSHSDVGVRSAVSLVPSSPLTLGPAFEKVFANVPIPERQNPIYVDEKHGPLSWNVVWLEAKADTEIAKEALSFLKASGII